MATTTVNTLAEELKRSADNLLEQLRAAGIDKSSGDDKLTEQDKTILLAHLQKVHGTADASGRKKITLTKRETSEIRQADSAGRTRTVQVEVRKKRVLVKRDEAEAVAAPAAPVTPVAPAVPVASVIGEEELAKRAAEASRQAELLARQEADLNAANEERKKKAEEAAKKAEEKSKPKATKAKETTEAPVAEVVDTAEADKAAEIKEAEAKEEATKVSAANAATAEAELKSIRERRERKESKSMSNP